MATQSEIDAAKQKMQNAETAKNNLYASMQSWCSKISGYTFKEVGTTLCSDKNKVYPSCGEEFEGDCCYSTKYSSQTCESDKATYNRRVSEYDNAVDAYESAKEEYDNLKEQSGEENVTKIEQDASGIRTRYYVFGGIVVVLIIVAVIVIMKLKK